MVKLAPDREKGGADGLTLVEYRRLTSRHLWKRGVWDLR